MEINKIVGELRNKYGELKGYIVKEKIIVSVEKISNIYESTKDNILYITTVDVLNSMEKDLSNTNFIVIENSKETIKPKEQCNLIYIGENVSIEKLYNEVKSMLDQNIEENTIISDLYSVMPLEQYLEPLLDKAFKYMQNPITYYDHLHNVKDFRKNKTIDNTAWEKDIELGHMDYSALKEHFYLCLETLINKGEIEFPVLKNRCKIYTIKYEKTVLGFMAALEYNREFKELDFKILSTVAHIIAIKSFNNTFTTSADGYIYSDVFKELLDEKIKSKVEFQGLLKTRNWKEKSFNRILLIKDNKDGSFEYINYIKQRISHLYQNFKIIYYEDYVVILEEYDNEREKKLHDMIIDLLLKTNQTVGVSDVFRDLITMKKYFQQAEKAIVFSELLKCNNKINYYSNFRFIDFIKQLNDKVNYDDYCHPSILHLEEYDNLYKTELGKTLSIYLENDRSVTKSSSIMNVHKNTISYRINKIKELLNIDFHNSSEIFHIVLSYKIRNLGDKLQVEKKVK